MTTTTPGLIAFLNARMDEDEAAATEACEPDVSQNGEWIAYGHPPGMRDGRKDRDVQLVGAGPDEASWTVCEVGQWDRAPQVGAHIARHDPARVLRQVEAGRAIVRWHAAECTCSWCTADGDDLPEPDFAPACPILCFLAAIYRDHPDYRQEWAVSP